MDETPTSTSASLQDDTVSWQKRLAGQANNRAWELSEAASRTAAEDDEMLSAAHAALHLWKIVGTPNNTAHAEQLVAHVSALLGQSELARHYAATSTPFFLAGDCEPWERAIAHSIAANVAACTGDAAAHGTHYRQAEQLIAALPDETDREIVSATLGVVPRPVTDG